VPDPDDRMATAAYQPEPRAAAAARRFVRDTLRTWRLGGPEPGRADLIDDAVLLTSELVTNAVAHTASGTGGKVVVTVYRADTRVRVEVRDGGSSRVPAVCSGGTAEESGYGLRLVELIARCWGYRGGQRGRIVWFMLEWKPNP
jgi:anti-sigma regulatory factor (Ser/Thr protein kinase)